MPEALKRVTRLAWRVQHRLQREWRRCVEKLQIQRVPTHVKIEVPMELAARFQWLNRDALAELVAQAPELSALVLEQSRAFLAHEFNLLGSGPTVVRHGLRCSGVAGKAWPPAGRVQADAQGRWLEGRINRTNLAHSQHLWQLISPGYVPIDWQLDFKSGYRWREDVGHRDIRFAQWPGVDVKVPWELSRLQHLPTLAMAAHFAQAGTPGFCAPSGYVQAFRDQVLDFIATNPPGFGVNWVCAMDVGIRCANLLVAHDISVTSGVQLDEAFKRNFAASILAHARHITSNLEWSPVYRGNHYLANIVGLLFAAAYLPECEETNGWLVFATQELLNEVNYQFHDDGSNFEASVCYHRLSSEMVLWAFALLANLPAHKLSVLTDPHRHAVRKMPRLAHRPLPLHLIPGSDRASPVPPWCWERLLKMADFTAALTRPDGLVVQFGDNDSGRFISLCSSEQLRVANDPSAPGWSLDHLALVTSIVNLVGETGSSAVTDDPGANIVRGFAGLGEVRPRPSCGSARLEDVGNEEKWFDCLAMYEKATIKSRSADHFSARHPALLEGIKRQAFLGMGCFVFRGPRFFLAVRCGEIGVAGLGAHAHCDQLAIELVIDGEDCVRDPGTYLYTASPQARNTYRCSAAHHVPHVIGREPANLELGLFDLRGAAEGECLYFGPRGFVGRHAGYGSWVYRIVSLSAAGVTVFDFAEDTLELNSSRPKPLPFSPAYGRTVGQVCVPFLS
jgi:hypothetical protein